MISISEKIVLITGASSGIGRSFATSVASRGGIPILLARRKERLKTLSEEIEKKFNIKPYVLQVDLLERDFIKNIDSYLENNSLTVDFLINNAGFGYNGKFLETEASTYNRMNTLNITALTDLSYHFADQMAKRKSGGILNVASMAGFSPIPLFTVYAATKAYVLRFSQALWYEMKPLGVHVSCLCPGPVDTEFFEVAGAKPAKSMMRNIQNAKDVAEIGINGLLKNLAVVPTSTPLKILSKVSSFIPDILSMKNSEKIMKKQSE